MSYLKSAPSNFSKGPGSASSEDPGPGPLYKVYMPSQMLSTVHMLSVNEINYFSILLIQLHTFKSVVYSVCMFLSTEIQR